MTELSNKTCISCKGSTSPISKTEITNLLNKLQQWTYNEQENHITKQFKFKGFYKTMAFVNAIAWIANQEGHHPTLTITYNQCTIEYTTHAAKVLTENDFICAAKIDNLI